MAAKEMEDVVMSSIEDMITPEMKEEMQKDVEEMIARTGEDPDLIKKIYHIAAYVVCATKYLAVTEGREAARTFIDYVLSDWETVVPNPCGMQAAEYRQIFYDSIDRAIQKKKERLDQETEEEGVTELARFVAQTVELCATRKGRNTARWLVGVLTNHFTMTDAISSESSADGFREEFFNFIDQKMQQNSDERKKIRISKQDVLANFLVDFTRLSALVLGRDAARHVMDEWIDEWEEGGHEPDEGTWDELRQLFYNDIDSIIENKDTQFSAEAARAGMIANRWR